MNEPLQRLVALADTDRLIRLTEGRLSELQGEEASLQARVAQLDQEMKARQESHRRLRAEGLARMNEVDATDEKIRTYQRKLEQEILPYKEMEYLRDQVVLLKSRIDGLAEEALLLSDQVEQDAEKLKEDEAAFRQRRQALEEELQALLHHRAALAQEKEGLLAQRAAQAELVPPHLLQQYERLRRTVGSPVVPVQGGTCGGCHLRLAEATLTRVKEGREVVTCENCSRFLYWRAP